MGPIHDSRTLEALRTQVATSSHKYLWFTAASDREEVL